MFLSSEQTPGQDCRRAVPGKTRRPVRRGEFEETSTDWLVRHRMRKHWKTDRPSPKLIESDFYSTELSCFAGRILGYDMGDGKQYQHK